MVTEVFNFGNFNSEGICHAICGQWIKKSRYGVQYGNNPEGVTSLDELGTKAFLKRVWDEADDTEHINRNNLLGNPLKTIQLPTQRFGGTLDPVVVARELTMGYNQYYLLIIDFYDRSRHALAAKRMRAQNGLQFLDPNFSCWKFDTSFEMYNHISTHISTHYGQLAIKTAEIGIYSA